MSRSVRRVALLHGMQVQQLLESTRMTYRAQRSTSARGVTFFLSGEMDSDHVAELGALNRSRAASHDQLGAQRRPQVIRVVRVAGAVVHPEPERVAAERVVVREVEWAESADGAEAPPVTISMPAIAITTCRLPFRGW